MPGAVRIIITGFWVCFCTILWQLSALAQQRDAGVWTAISVETGVVKHLTLSVSQELRLNENATEINKWLSEAGLQYKISKHLKASVNYRFTMKNNLNNRFTPGHRWFIDIKADRKEKPFLFQFRTRFQEEIKQIGRAPDGGIPGYHSRNKLSVGLDLDRKWEPFVSVELFTPLFAQQPVLFDDIRTAAGLDIKIAKKQKLELYYMIQRELHTGDPLTDFIGGVGYSFKL